MKKGSPKVVTQLILLLAAALFVMLLTMLGVLYYVRAQQDAADEVYYQLKVEEETAKISAQLKSLNIVAAQLIRNSLIQDFLSADTTLEKWEYIESVSDVLNILYSNNSQISAAVIYNLEGEHYFSADFTLHMNQVLPDMYDICSTENKSSHFELLQIHAQHEYSMYAYFAPIFSLQTNQKIGTLLLLGSCNKLLDENRSEYVSTCLWDGYGHCYPQTNAESEQTASLPYAAHVGFRQIQPYVDMSARSAFSLMVGISLFVLCMLLAMGVFLMRNFARPVADISGQMKKIRQGMQNSIHISRGGMEFMSLCDGINAMLNIIEQRNQENMRVQEQLYQKELACREAQLYALRSQINPHFLYNTLQTLRGMAMYHGEQEIARIVTDMAFIFRYIIQDNPIAEMTQEMEVAQRYMEIMNARFPNRFAYSAEIEPELSRCLVPRMIMQPLMENAVKYAFECSKSPALHAKIYAQGSTMYIVVRDNGCGMSEDALAEIRAHLEQPEPVQGKTDDSGIGLRNIHRRLCMRYGREYGVEIASRQNEGTCVTLKLPMERDI